MSSVIDAGPVVRTNQLDYDDEVVYKSKQYLYDHVRYRKDQPFSLTVSMTHPHDPYNMTPDYWDLYEDVDIPLPKVPAFPQDEQDPHAKRLLKCIDLWGKTMPEDKIRAARRAYFSACTYVDTKIGQLLRVLEDCGLADDTIIVFTGDHGDMLGERGLWYKMNWYEGAGRVPMVVHAPGKYAAKRVRENVSTMDLLPTFVSMIGSAVHAGLPMDGLSLMPYITGEKGLKTDTVIGEYMGEGTQSPLVMIRRGPWKFVYCPLDPPQLFNLDNDPLELQNLAAGYSNTLPSRAEASKNAGRRTSQGLPPTPPDGPTFDFNANAAVSAEEETSQATSDAVTEAKTDIASIIKSFMEEAALRWDFDAVTADVLESQRRRRFVWGALTKGVPVIWDYAPPVDASALYVRNQGKGVLDDVEFMSRWPRVSR